MKTVRIVLACSSVRDARGAAVCRAACEGAVHRQQPDAVLRPARDDQAHVRIRARGQSADRPRPGTSGRKGIEGVLGRRAKKPGSPRAMIAAEKWDYRRHPGDLQRQGSGVPGLCGEVRRRDPQGRVEDGLVRDRQRHRALRGLVPLSRRVQDTERHAALVRQEARGIPWRPPDTPG